LHHQLTDSGATAIVVVENFCHVVEKVKSRTSLQHVIVTGVGDLLGFPKGALVNFVLRHVKQAVPAWKIDGAVRLNDALRAHAGQRPTQAQITPDDIAFLQYTGGTTGVSK